MVRPTAVKGRSGKVGTPPCARPTKASQAECRGNGCGWSSPRPQPPQMDSGPQKFTSWMESSPREQTASVLRATMGQGSGIPAEPASGQLCSWRAWAPLPTSAPPPHSPGVQTSPEPQAHPAPSQADWLKGAGLQPPAEAMEEHGGRGSFCPHPTTPRPWATCWHTYRLWRIKAPPTRCCRVSLEQVGPGKLTDGTYGRWPGRPKG